MSQCGHRNIPEKNATTERPLMPVNDSKPTMAVGFGATMPGNTLVRIVCGWLFWHRCLIAAIVAHFSIDFLLHVLPAILGPIDGL